MIPQCRAVRNEATAVAVLGHVKSDHMLSIRKTEK